MVVFCVSTYSREDEHRYRLDWSTRLQCENQRLILYAPLVHTVTHDRPKKTEKV